MTDRVMPDPIVVQRQNDLFDLWHDFADEHADEPDYDPDDDPAFHEQARQIMGIADTSRSLTPTEEDEVSRADDEPEIDEDDDDFDPEIDYHVSCVDWDADDEAERAEFDEFDEFDEDDEDDELIRAMDRNRLKHYWTKGKGLVKWLGRPHPWTALYRHLRKYVGAERAKRMAAQWVHDVTGNWPGSDAHRVATGHKPRGSRIGPG